MAEYAVPEIKKEIEVPALEVGTMKDQEPIPAKEQHMTPLGFPGERVENWQKQGVAEMDDMLKKYRSLQVFMDICVKCGSCTDKCHYFIGTQDPNNMPV
ncbi:MAG: (Fe-S)-binding protein, partial [Magnetococcales bacterium]|nr:(Fe-S)-binding protein [Magnetococcales bacterium]